MAFVSSQKFELGEEADVSVFLPTHETIQLKGKIIRKVVRNNLNDYSMQFGEISPHDSRLLTEFIQSLEAEMQQMHDDYFEYIKELL